jgi:hypothetical protein
MYTYNWDDSDNTSGVRSDDGINENIQVICKRLSVHKLCGLKKREVMLHFCDKRLVVMLLVYMCIVLNVCCMFP